MTLEGQKNEFQVSWQHLNYWIRHKPDFLDKIGQEIQRTLRSTQELKFSSRRGSYDLEQSSDIDSSQPSHEAIQILHNLSGSFRSGQLTAILGPSGAGKTTLLNFLSRRTEDGYDGSLIVTGRTGRKITVNAIAQTDYLPEYLTVRENLTFASKLKNPTLDGLDHEKNVARVSHLLGLDECLDTRTQKISGGQQKRLSIAQELLSKPDVLILDEPTSGLDSSTCLHTLSVLSGIVKGSNVAIVLTIHQPPLEALDFFDKIYVLASAGQVIYDGPPSRCAEFVNTYSRVELPQGYNPAHFLIEIGSGELGQKPIEALRNQVEQEFQASHCGLHKGGHNKLHVDARFCRGALCDGGHYMAKTRCLINRCMLSMRRDPKQMISRVMMHLVLPFGMVLMLGREPGDSNACPEFANEYNLQQVVGSDKYTSIERQKQFLLSHENVLMFYILIYSCICGNIAGATLIFVMDMRSSLREYNNGWYSMGSYMAARLISNIGQDVVLPTLTVGLTYWLTGQNTQNGELADLYRVLIISLALVVGNCASQVLGMTFGAIYVDQITSALFVSQAATLPFVLLSGFLVRVKEMSALVRLLSLTSIYRHCLEATFVARYGFNVCGCRSLGSAKVAMTGVPENLRWFSSTWLDSMETEDDNGGQSNSTLANDDIFQLIAKQLNLYNTYGIDVQSCKDIVPYQLHDFNLDERNLVFSFSALFALLALMVVILFVTIKLTVSRKASL